MIKRIGKYICEKYSNFKNELFIEDYLHKHGSTHCCPKCNLWEHEGNTIHTEIYDRGTDKRTCTNCGHIWRSHFCPAGHVWLEDYVWDGEEFVKKEVVNE